MRYLHMLEVSHPVMHSLLVVDIATHIMGPDTQTCWLANTCAGCFRDVCSRSTTPCSSIVNVWLHILTSQPLCWSCHYRAPPQLASPGLHPGVRTQASLSLSLSLVFPTFFLFLSLSSYISFFLPIFSLYVFLSPYISLCSSLSVSPSFNVAIFSRISPPFSLLCIFLSLSLFLSGLFCLSLAFSFSLLFSTLNYHLLSLWSVSNWTKPNRQVPWGIPNKRTKAKSE